MKRVDLCALIAIAVVFIVPSAALAQERAVCSPADMTSPGTGRVVSYYDAGAKGVSPGDARVGKRTLVDASGETVGEVRWHNTPISPSNEAEDVFFITKIYFLLSGGMIITESIIAPRATMTDVETVSTDNSKLVVLGGTGEFHSASGVVTQVVEAEGDPKRIAYTFDLRC